MKRRLVLLTNQFPFDFGDHSFVRHEIDALSNAFDDVVVFNYSSRESTTLAPLPRNVSYGGNLYGMSRLDILRATARPRNLLVLARVAVAEARETQLAKNLMPFLKSALTGMRIANDAGLRQALEAPGFQTSVYSFWGMGAGLSLPWLPRSLSRVSVRLHRYDLYKDQGINGYLPFRAALFARANNIMPISEAGRKYLLANHPTLGLGSKIVVRRLGSSEPLVDKSVSDAAPRASGAQHVILSCSNLIPVKRVDQIIRALESLDTEKSLRWIHFGGGPLEDELRTMAAAAARDGLDIEFAGATSNDKIQEFYAANTVDLFVNVSSSEGIPVSIMEAISYDIKVLATDVGGTSEIVGPELGTGMLLPADFSVAELAAAITLMLENPAASLAPKGTWRRLYNASTNSQVTAALVSGRPA